MTSERKHDRQKTCDAASAEYYFLDPDASRLPLLSADDEGDATDDDLMNGHFPGVAAGPDDCPVPYDLGRKCEAGDGIPADDAKTAAWYQAAVEKNDCWSLVAIFKLAGFYESGRGIVQDDSLAFKYYRRASDLGLVNALVPLGRLYEKGRGVRLSLITAVSLYLQAAQFGIAEGGFEIARVYREGVRVEKDLRIAALWDRVARGEEVADGPGAIGQGAP